MSPIGVWLWAKASKPPVDECVLVWRALDHATEFAVWTGTEWQGATLGIEDPTQYLRLPPHPEQAGGRSNERHAS